MPYRSEFTTAGLAVTSKEQANRIDSYITKAVEARAPAAPAAPGSCRRPEKQTAAVGKPSQMDGFDNTDPSDSPNTEISFAHSKAMDEWRYALIDEVPAKKRKKKAAGSRKGKKHCLSCFDHSPSTVTEGEWADVPKKLTGPVPTFRGGIGPPPVGPPPPVPPQRPPQRPPRPPVGLFDTELLATPHERPEKLTSTSHALSPRMLPKRKSQRDKSKSPKIPRQGSPHPRIISSKPPDSPQKELRSSPRRPTMASSRPIPHEATSKQFDRNVQQATPFGLKQAVENVEKDQKAKKNRSSKSSQLRRDGGDRDHIGICCRGGRGIRSRANARPNIPRRTSSMAQFMFSSKLDYDDREITDRDVLRGLHIAASAACDEEVDAFVRNQTGLRIRRFLADLLTLETLAVTPPVDKRQWARQRRADMRRLKQQLRRSREISGLKQTNYL
ncbi:hypothetical protein NQ176_g7447 [Zarea fungicola]|uniref:Uncharacterized protein n=1 Tax=Zarea fungicola TaxID=93591 RepID=A0ACC1MY31_9HYPO|nr:hypothetical protein NQ176_g7447 [Lecanicillium fungicola]